jgi:hypothetical protein
VFGLEAIDMSLHASVEMSAEELHVELLYAELFPDGDLAPMNTPAIERQRYAERLAFHDAMEMDNKFDDGLLAEHELKHKPTTFAFGHQRSAHVGRRARIDELCDPSLLPAFLRKQAD